MNRIQQSIEVTFKVSKARDAARLLLGNKYRARMADYRAILDKVMAAKHVDKLTAASLLCDATDDPLQIIEILAGVAEMAEPSAVPA